MRRLAWFVVGAVAVAALFTPGVAFGVAWVQVPTYLTMATSSPVTDTLPGKPPNANWWAVEEIELPAPTSYQWGVDLFGSGTGSGTGVVSPFPAATVALAASSTVDSSLGGVLVFQSVGAFVATSGVQATISETGSPVCEPQQLSPTEGYGLTFGGVRSSQFVPTSVQTGIGRYQDYGAPVGWRGSDANPSANMSATVDDLSELLSSYKTSVVVGVKPIPNSANFTYRVVWADRVEYGRKGAVTAVTRGAYSGTIARASVQRLFCGAQMHAKARIVKWSTDRWVWATGEQLSRVRTYRILAAGRSLATTDAAVLSTVMDSLDGTAVAGVAGITSPVFVSDGSVEESSTGNLPIELPLMPGAPDFAKSWAEGQLKELDAIAAKFQEWLWPLYTIAGVFQ